MWQWPTDITVDLRFGDPLNTWQAVIKITGPAYQVNRIVGRVERVQQQDITPPPLKTEAVNTTRIHRCANKNMRQGQQITKKH